MIYNFIKTDIQGHVFTLTLDRDAKRNAFGPTMVNEVAHAIAIANEQEQVKVVVLKANGSVFCAGMDLKTYQHPELDRLNPNIENKNISLGQVMDGLFKPSIAVVQGDVIAGGFLFVLGCSYVFAKKEVNFKLPEVSVGIFPFQVMASLLRVMPEKKVLQLCLDTNYFSTDKAIDYGIVDGILEHDKLQLLLDSFAHKSTDAIQAGMKALKQIREIHGYKQYDFLLESLNALKDQKEVKDRIENTLKKS